MKETILQNKMYDKTIAISILFFSSLLGFYHATNIRVANKRFI